MHVQQMLNIADKRGDLGHVFAVCMKEYQHLGAADELVRHPEARNFGVVSTWDVN